MRKSNTKSRIIFISFIFFLLMIVAIIMGYKAAMQCEYEYRLSAHPKKYSEFVEKYVGVMVFLYGI